MSAKEPLVSIIIPMYNCATFIKEAIGSCLEQSYQNFEIICVDDCSSDSTKSVVESLQKKDSRIKLISMSSHQGRAVARNHGLECGMGDYFAFLDGEDYFSKDALELCIKAIQQNPCDMVCFNAIMFNSHQSLIILTGGPHDVIPHENDCRTSRFLSLFVNNTFALVSSKLIRQNHITFVPNRIYEYWEFTSHCLSKAGRMIYINKPLYYCRQPDTSILKTTAVSLTSKICDIFHVCNLAKHYYENSNRWNNVEFLFFYKSFACMVEIYKNHLYAQHIDVEKEFLQKFSDYLNQVSELEFLSVISIMSQEDKVLLFRIRSNYKKVLLKSRLKWRFYSESIHCYRTKAGINLREIVILKDAVKFVRGSVYAFFCILAIISRGIKSVFSKK